MDSTQSTINMSTSDLEELRIVFLDLDISFDMNWNQSNESSDSIESNSFLSYLNYSDAEISIEPNLDRNNPEEIDQVFEKYVDNLQLESIKNVESCEWTKYFLLKNGIIRLILMQKEYNRKLSNHIVKLHDVIANAFHGKIEVEHLLPINIVKRVMTSILFCQTILCLQEERQTQEVQDYTFLAPTIVTAITNYSSNYDSIMIKYIIALHKLCSKSSAGKSLINCSKLVSNLNSTGKEVYFKNILRHCVNSQMVYEIIPEPSSESCDIFVKVLLSRMSFGCINTYKMLICYLSRVSIQKKRDDTFFGSILINVLQAWADPIIARAHVFAEVVHYAHLIFVLFYHLVSNRSGLQIYQQRIVEYIAKGLPNHLNSSDFRTVSLAKLICEMVTESLKFYAGSDKGDNLNDKFLHSYMDDDLCRQVLEGYQKDCCDAANNFWMSKYTIPVQIEEQEPINKAKGSTFKSSEDKIDSDDDEDDDDLKPIETLDVPPQNETTKIVYVRDFLEKLPEFKTYDEMSEALKTLPNIIKHQLLYDHGQVGIDVLNAVFRWENDFDQPLLDEYRKNNLCTILKTKTEGNVEHFCKYFHGESQLQPYKKNLILDVLSTVSKDIPLKQLEVLANSAFHHILYDENCVKSEDVTVKIPLILFFSNLMCNTLPRIMVKEDMVISYLRCLTQIEGESAATEQTARYAIHNLIGALEGFQFSENVQASISDTRTWLCRLQNAQINYL